MAEVKLNSTVESQSLESKGAEINVPMNEFEVQTDVPANGLNQEEKKDPNKINVSVVDVNAPLVILFGPPSCGKTMTLIRLTRYLKNEGYSVSPIRTFRPSQDNYYKKMCEGYNTLVNQNDAASATNMISFMLVEVLLRGKRLCQILEAPGEYYFDPKRPRTPFPNYVNTIINSNNRKIWNIFVEPDWRDAQDRSNYVDKIAELKKSMRPSDKTVFMFNKIDMTAFVISPGYVNMKQAIAEVESLYPSIFSPFKNQNPISRFWKQYLCDCIPFQTGTYTKAADGTITFQQGHDVYVRKLWNMLVKKING